MTDEDLRILKRHELGDLARNCYDQEVARRGLDLTPPAPAPPKHKIVSVATFVFPGDAILARALLESAGLPAYLENEHTLAANWMLTNVIGGLHLLVPAVVAEEARAILRSRVSDEELAAQAEASKPRTLTR